MPGESEVQYLVLPNATNPYFLARVRWPDIHQAISSARPEWQDDPGLFDLPYNASSTRVTADQAAAIAADWGAHLPSEDTPHVAEFSLIRRMPADWSNLSPAEKRAWNLEFVRTRRSITVGGDGATSRSTRRYSRAWLGRWRRDRAVVSPVDAGSEPEQEELILDLRDSAVEPGAGVEGADARDESVSTEAPILDLRDSAVEPGTGDESADARDESVSTEAPILDLRDSAVEPGAGDESADARDESVSTEAPMLDLRDSAVEPGAGDESAVSLTGSVPIAVSTEAPNGRRQDAAELPVPTAQVLDLRSSGRGAARGDLMDEYRPRLRSWLGRWRRDRAVISPWSARSEPEQETLTLGRRGAPAEVSSGFNAAEMPSGPPMVSTEAATGGEDGADPSESTAPVIDLRDVVESTEPDDRIDESATS